MPLNFLDRKVANTIVKTLERNDAMEVVVFNKPKRFNADIQEEIEKLDRFYFFIDINPREKLVVTSKDAGKAWDHYCKLMNANLSYVYFGVKGDTERFAKVATGIVKRMNSLRETLQKENEGLTLPEYALDLCAGPEAADEIVAAHHLKIAE